MKKILITGANSYIGTNLKKWLEKDLAKYKVETIDVKGDSWKEKDFSAFDVVFHVAAIVHQKEKHTMQHQYFKINRDLPVEIAMLAKSSGVKQFIFMSSMAVYGEAGRIDKEIVITKETKPNPNTYYGKSKVEAEIELNKMTDENFKVVIIRPPIVYGNSCPGNYKKLEKISKITPVFPMIENKRSMLHIDKLCEHVKKYIDDEAMGLFLPQDDEYINTSLLVKGLAEQYGNKIILSKTLGRLIRLIGKRFDLINKVFGNLVYERD